MAQESSTASPYEREAVRTAVLNSQRNQNHLEVARSYLEAGLFYSSSTYLKGFISNPQNLRNLSERDQRFIEEITRRLIIEIGATTFKIMDINHINLLRFSPSLNYIQGVKLLENGREEEAISLLQTVPHNHPLAPNTFLLLSNIYFSLNRFDEMMGNISSCIEIASRQSDRAREVPRQRYFRVIQEKCTMNLARYYFEKREFRKSIEIYDQIPKTSYLWPYTLLEKAWAFFHLEDYNRSLGLLVTYKSPLLESYFFPEGEVLNALNYHELCLWRDAEQVIQQYYRVFRPRSDQLRAMLNQHDNSPYFFIQLLGSNLDQLARQNRFIRNLATQIKKQTKYNIELEAYQKGMRELQFLRSLPESAKQARIAGEIQDHLRLRTQYFNHYIKAQFTQFINSMHAHSYDMFNIRLEIMGNRRNLLYDNRELISDRSRGSLKNVNRTSREHFFEFNGEFWADELGDYSFGLQSNCQTVSRNR